MKPLAYLMRPKHYDDIIGQDHLVGPNGVLRRMISSKRYFSFIIYGDPGIGKTTIAEATCQMSESPFYRFNASTDPKEKLKQIVNEARFNQSTFVIVDEIHRMKADIQDFLLPSLENGTITMIGLTTVNPYHSINPAIRSRCHIYQLNHLDKKDLEKIVERFTAKYCEENELKDTILWNDDVSQYLIQASNGEIRTLINYCELLANLSNNELVTIELAQNMIQKANIAIDKNQDNHFDTLSGFHKSLRGSDVQASLHYLAKLILVGDLPSISRRLLCVVYEDVGMANSSLGPKVKAAVDSAYELGFPEARLPLAQITVEIALSPKSNTTASAIDAALRDLELGKSGTLPLHLKNINSFNPKQTPYKYPHDYPNAWVDQQYLPDELVDAVYYIPKDNTKNEKVFKERFDQLKSWRRK